MKKTKDNESSPIDNEEITNKVLDLCIWYQIEDSYHWMRLIEQQIKFCEIQIAHLEKYKPYWFQKKKLKAHYEDIELLEDKICDYYRQINDEVKLIEKMRSSISKEN